MESNIKKQTKPQKANEAILSDRGICQLLEIKLNIYKNTIPQYIMTPKVGLRAIYSNEISVRLNEIDSKIEAIKHRILSFYNCL